LHPGILWGGASARSPRFAAQPTGTAIFAGPKSSPHEPARPERSAYNQGVMTPKPQVKLSQVRTAALTALAVLLIGCMRSSTLSSNESSDSAIKAESERKPAPEFNLTDANGASVKLADYKGKVVLLNFWATWCGPCKVEIPWFMEFEQQYKDRDFAVLGVSFDDDGWKSVKPYVEQHKINYRIMIGSDELGQLYGNVDALPTSFIIDREGRIAARHEGLVDKQDYQNEILKLLEDPKSADRGNHPGASVALLRPDQRP
jgi:peroxiredoxin